jgi:hypothetical protein
MNPAFFHAPVSLHPLLCGSTDQAAYYHLLSFLGFGLHLLMTLGYSHTSLLFLIYNHVAAEEHDFVMYVYSTIQFEAYTVVTYLQMES